MARLIDQVSAHQPSVIAIDILYTERSNLESVITREQFPEIQRYLYSILSGVELRIQSREGTRIIGPGSPGFDRIAEGAALAAAQDAELAEAVRRAAAQGIGVVLAAQSISGQGVAGLLEPYPVLADAAPGSLGLVGIRPDADGVLREYLPYGQDKDGNFVYGLALAAVARSRGAALPDAPLPDGSVPIGDDVLAEVAGGRFLVNFSGPPGTYPTFGARDILRGEDDFSRQLKDKIVFIGVTAPGVGDMYLTPFSGAERMSGVEFHAAAADTLLRGAIIEKAPRYLELLALAVLGLAAIALGRFVRPLIGFAGALAMAGGLAGAWMALFAGADYLLAIASPLAAIAAGYGVALTDRVGVEQLEKQQARLLLSQYLSPAVVTEVLRSRDASMLGGKRAEISVLFSDIRGFTTLSERLAPEEVVGLLNEYLAAMTEVIFRHEGTVDKFEGDAILAFFGAPKPQDDAADRAVQTALEMRGQLAALDERWRERTQSSLWIGIGINTGYAVVGNIGSQKRMDYTIIGDAVNLASRLQDMTKEYGASILISGETRARLKRLYQLRPLGRVEVRGRQQTVELYEVNDPLPDAHTDGAGSLQHSQAT